jgi:hypothetical protein
MAAIPLATVSAPVAWRASAALAAPAAAVPSGAVINDVYGGGGNSGATLIGEAAGPGGTTGLPSTQASGSINMSATSSTVAPVDNSTPQMTIERVQSHCAN